MLFLFALVVAVAHAANVPWACTIRFHRRGNCPNTRQYNGDDGDVIRSWTVTDNEAVVWKSGQGFRVWSHGGGYFHEPSLAERLEDWTSAVSLEGKCGFVEIFDEDIIMGGNIGSRDWDPNLDRSLQKAEQYEDNCRVEHGKILTNHRCHWSCLNRDNGCPGETPRCVTLRHDLNDDVGGFRYAYKNPGKPEDYDRPTFHWYNMGRSVGEFASTGNGAVAALAAMSAVAVVAAVGVVACGRKKSEGEYAEIKEELA